MHGSMRARGCDSPGLLDPDTLFPVWRYRHLHKGLRQARDQLARKELRTALSDASTVVLE